MNMSTDLATYRKGQNLWKKRIVLPTRFKANPSKERGASIKLQSTHKSRNKSLAEIGVILRCCNWA